MFPLRSLAENQIDPARGGVDQVMISALE